MSSSITPDSLTLLQTNMNVRDGFPFIQQMIMDAFHVDTYLFTDPYGDVSVIDHGFRKMVWKDYPKSQPNTALSRDGGYKIVVSKSSLGFYNVIAYVSLDNNPDFISVGPFRDYSPTDSFYRQILSNNHLSADFLRLVQNFYQTLPIADPGNISVMLQHLLSVFIPEFTSLSPMEVNFKDEVHSVVQNDETMNFFSVNHCASYAKSLTTFLKSLESGNTSESEDKLQQLLHYIEMPANTPIREVKNRLLELNALCKGRLICLGIQPYHVIQAYFQFESEIEHARSTADYHQLLQKICRKYTLLVHNYNLATYSYLIRNVISFINSHLGDELTLSKLADTFQRNPSSLSGQFRKETGSSLTEYIHSERIKEALLYFNTSELSVSEVADRVGIPDSAYFSRLFKKHVGTSPNSYRRMMQKEYQD